MERISKEWVPNSAETDDELSEGEFTDDESLRKYYIKSRMKDMEQGIKKRKKSAKKAEKRMGGPPKIWSEEANRKRAEKMAKGEDVKEEKAKKAAKEEPKKKVKENEKAKVKEKPTKATKEKEVKKSAKKEKKGAKKEKKERKSRGPSIIDGKITILVKENPKRKGTNAYKKFELYKKHKSIAQYLEAGGKRSSLRYDEKHEYIKLSNITKKGESKSKKEAA